uniref:CSON001053 protein n=1 Tax=Culicoides sonorensis TaxID=179676 RepID=A0A336KB03_CULSO
MTDKLSPSDSGSERRPLSQYDNLASVSMIGTSPPVKEELMFKDIKFQFDDINQDNSRQFNKSVISDAKSMFFGLHKPGNNGTQRDENLPLMSEQESQTPKITTPVASKLNASELLKMTDTGPGNSSEAVSSHNSSNSSSNNNNNNSNNGKSKKQITLLVDDNDSSSVGQSFLGSSSPSQAVYMSTTVPQNISKTNIGERHKPTRTSLRHSRMLVLKNIEGNRNLYALNIDCRLLARICYTALLVSGLFIGTICLGILLWAPNTSAKDNCFWSGIVLFICGIVVMGITELKKVPQTNCIKENYFTFLKVNCGILLILAIFCSSLAFIYGAIHFTTLNSNEKECLPENLLIASSSCICLFGDRRNMTQDFNSMISNNNGSNGEIRNISFNDSSAGFEIHYRDLSCHEVAGIWYYVILVLMVLNGLGLIAAITFLVIFSISIRNRARRYTSVRLNQP